MTPSAQSGTAVEVSRLAHLLLTVPAGRRGAVFQHVVSFCTNGSLDAAFAVGPLRAAFAEMWEERVGGTVPVQQLRRILEPPVPVLTGLEFSRLVVARDETEIGEAVVEILKHLCKLAHSNSSPQIK